MSRLQLDRLLKRLDAADGLDCYRIGTAEVGSPSLAEKADVGTRLFLGIAIDWLPDGKRACRLLRVPTGGSEVYVLTVEGRTEVIASSARLQGLYGELERLELSVHSWNLAPCEELAR